MSFFAIFSLISSTFSFGMKKCRMLSNVVPLVGQILRGSIAVVLRHQKYVVDALQIATCKYVKCETLYTADKKLAEVAEAENVASVLLGRP
jgi:predicted nucleic acid-binding protein